MRTLMIMDNTPVKLEIAEKNITSHLIQALSPFEKITLEILHPCHASSAQPESRHDFFSQTGRTPGGSTQRGETMLDSLEAIFRDD